MKLIDDWKRAHRLWSVRIAGATTVLAGADWLLPNVQGMIPPGVYFGLTAAIFVARIVKQEKK